MKNAERKANFSKYILLTLGSIIILIPLLATIFSSFKSTKDIVNNFFGFPAQAPDPYVYKSNQHQLASDDFLAKTYPS